MAVNKKQKWTEKELKEFKTLILDKRKVVADDLAV